MKKKAKAIVSAVSAVALTFALALPTSAKVRGTQTDSYGYLTGSVSQSGTVLNTSVTVDSNNYSATLRIYGQITDGIDTTISSFSAVSPTGATSLEKTVQMISIIRSVAKPGYAFTTDEVRGGSKEGDYISINMSLDSSYF